MLPSGVCVWAPHTIPESPVSHKFQPSLPLPPLPIITPSSALPPLLPGSPSAHPQPTISGVLSPRVCQSPSVSWLDDTLSPPPASESLTLPWPSGKSLLSTVARQSTSSAGLPRPSGSTLVCRRPVLALGLHFSNSSTLRWTPLSLQLHLGPLSLRSLPDPRLSLVRLNHLPQLVLRILLVALACLLSVSTLCSSSTCYATIGRPSGVISPSSSMAPPAIGLTVGCLHGCGQVPAMHLLLRLPPVLSLVITSVFVTLDPPVSILAPPSV